MKQTLFVFTLASALLMPTVATSAPKKAKTWDDWKAEWSKLSAESKKAIDKALPQKATAKPKKPRRALVFFRCGGFVHSSIGAGNYMLEQLGKRTKAFSADFTDVYADLNSANLKQYDLLIFNNTTHLVLENDAQRDAVVEFMKAGKGVAGIHAAGDNFYKWRYGAAMIGGQFNGHPWTANGKWAFQIDDPKHVLNKAFHGKGFWHTDEIYQYKPDTFEGEDKLRILVSLDMSKEKVSGLLKNPRFARFNEQYGSGPRSVPVSWLREFEGGRVFYTNFGHRDDTYQKANIVRHILDGIQYATGDLNADATPTAKTEKMQPSLAPAE